MSTDEAARLPAASPGVQVSKLRMEHGEFQIWFVSAHVQ